MFHDFVCIYTIIFTVTSAGWSKSESICRSLKVFVTKLSWQVDSHSRKKVGLFCNDAEKGAIRKVEQHLIIALVQTLAH